MPSPNRADHTWAKEAYKKAKKIIFSSQSVCGICGRPVNFDKKFPDPWSATIDHIIPLVKGGDPAQLENMQLAHLQCNRIKSSKLLEPQLKEKNVSNRDLPLSCDWGAIVP
jgi:5-methylcytosine-specific restriction endonuclease McrA